MERERQAQGGRRDNGPLRNHSNIPFQVTEYVICNIISPLHFGTGLAEGSGATI